MHVRSFGSIVNQEHSIHHIPHKTANLVHVEKVAENMVYNTRTCFRIDNIHKRSIHAI